MFENIYTLFKPDLSPKEMLSLGVFGGWYFEREYNEFPRDWFQEAKLSSNAFDVTKNCFGVVAGQTRKEWQAKGWITMDDPLGWFQWYCRYAMGRRLEEVDAFQIKRWKQFGPRHIGGIKKNCEPGDWTCRPRQRQALLQWAYDPFI
jgi:hypothetical protein